MHLKTVVLLFLTFFILGFGSVQAGTYYFEESKLLRHKQNLEEKQRELPKLIAQLNNLSQRFEALQAQGDFLRTKLKNAKQLHLTSQNSLEIQIEGDAQINRIQNQRLKLTGMFVQARVKHAYHLKRRIRGIEALINKRFLEIDMLETKIIEQELLVENLSIENFGELAAAY